MKAKTTVVVEPQEKKIDWSQPMWLTTKDGEIVLSNGEHNAIDFTGVCVRGTVNKVGDYSDEWSKQCFTPITSPITITISNE